ncbi:MAG: hypothetical protein WCF84_12170 [Anaerolineae bacterium]
MGKLLRLLFILLGILLVVGVVVQFQFPLLVARKRLPLPTPTLSVPAALAAAPTPTRLPARSNGAAVFLIPDSELVYGPAYQDFFQDAASAHFGLVAPYHERVEDEIMTGPDIIRLVAERYSVGPRVLLTLLEMKYGWVSGGTGYAGNGRSALYEEASQIADRLDEGYYGRVSGSLFTLQFADGRQAPLDDHQNPGTAALYYFFAKESRQTEWANRVGSAGFDAVYRGLFGDPFAHAVDPLIAGEVVQPPLHLPWADGHTWFYTGGPHGGYTTATGRAAIDLAPQGGSAPCAPAPDWATAAAPGRVVEFEHGRLMLNLSNQSFQGTGWTLMYLHIATPEHIVAGIEVKQGERLGHPSCEGGVATGSHIHFARLYNGQWIPADDARRPMVLSGWVVNSFTSLYEGTMIRGWDWRIASSGHIPSINGILADDGPATGK